MGKEGGTKIERGKKIAAIETFETIKIERKQSLHNALWKE